MITDEIVEVMEWLIKVTTSVTAEDALNMALEMLKAYDPYEWADMTDEQREEWVSNYAFT